MYEDKRVYCYFSIGVFTDSNIEINELNLGKGLKKLFGEKQKNN
jgi:hypothetical protein